jgi:hypothetical protein
VLVRGLAAAAAVVLVVGGGLLLANSGEKPQTAATAPAPHVKIGSAGSVSLKPVSFQNDGRVVYTDAVTSNADYTGANLADGVRRAVRAYPTSFSPAGASPAPGVNSTSTRSSGKAAASTKGTHAFPLSQLGACLSMIANGRTVILTELAHYLRIPVAIIVLEPSGAVFDVIVVGTACGSTRSDIIRTLTIPKS